MTGVREHYERHLAPVYAWMAGGVDAALARGEADLDAAGIAPLAGGRAVDLGAGFGMHVIPLARRGFEVLALDTSAHLLDLLRARTGALPIRAVHDDLRSFRNHLAGRPDLVLCMGDTLTHLPDRDEVTALIASVSQVLGPGGCFVLTLRDYLMPAPMEPRFIPVRSDDDRILTCFIEYRDTHVRVHDVLHERRGDGWELRVSAYDKLRIAPDWLCDMLGAHGFGVYRAAGAAGMTMLVAQRSLDPCLEKVP